MNFMVELICLTCKATKDGINVKASRFRYPHTKDCRVQDIRLLSTVKSIVPKLTIKDTEPVVNTSDAEDTPVPKAAPKVRAKRKIVPKKSESA